MNRSYLTDYLKLIAHRHGSVTALLVAASLGASAVAASGAMETNPITAADCDAAKLVEANVADAARGARSRADVSSKYIYEEKQKAASDQKGQNEILANFDRTSFKMDVPEIIIGSNKTSIPTVHVTMHRKSMHVPMSFACKIGTQTISQLVGLITRHISRDIMGTCSGMKEISMDVPEFTAGRTEINLPEFKVEMKTREFSLNLPQFEERTPENEVRKHEKNVKEEVDRLERDLGSMKVAYTAKAIAEVKRLLDDRQVDTLKALYTAGQEVIDELEKKKKEVRDRFTSAVTQLKQANAPESTSADVLRQMAIALRAMDDAETTTRGLLLAQEFKLRAMFDGLRSKYLASNVPASAQACRK